VPTATPVPSDRDAYRLLIGGEWIAAAGAYPVVNPATEQTIGFAPEASAEQARAAAAAARAAQPAWGALPLEARCALLARAADALEARLPEFVSLVQAETGSTLAVARQLQIGVAVDRFRRYARPERVNVALEPQMTPATPLGAGSVLGGVVVRQPVGVVACITPYNFPLTSLAGKIAPALAMGNCVVMRPAPQDPLAIFEMTRILCEAGFPPGVVNLVSGSGPESGAALVDSPDVDMVSFTGSSAVGMRIFEQGGKTMKRLLLELGGKGPALVFADADLDAATAAVGSTFAFHAGQVCTAPTRLIAQRAVYEPLVDRLAQLAKRLPLGDPLDPATVVPPVITRVHRDRVETFLARGRAEGAEIVAGGERPERRGYYVAPCLLLGHNRMVVAREEAFAPIVVAMPFDDEEEAVALANDSDYGLFGYVYTRDGARGMRVAQRLRTGCVGVNTVQPHHEGAFGGFKHSGVGRDRGVFGLHAYAELQSITWPG